MTTKQQYSKLGRSKGAVVALSYIKGQQTQQYKPVYFKSTGLHHSRHQRTEEERTIHDQIKEILLADTTMDELCVQSLDFLKKTNNSMEIFTEIMHYDMWEVIDYILKNCDASCKKLISRSMYDSTRLVMVPRWYYTDSKHPQIILPQHHKRTLVNAYQTLKLLYDNNLCELLYNTIHKNICINRLFQYIEERKYATPSEIELLLKMTNNDQNIIKYLETGNITESLKRYILQFEGNIDTQQYNTCAFQVDTCEIQITHKDIYMKIYNLVFHDLTPERQHLETSNILKKMAWSPQSIEEYHNALCWSASVAKHVFAMNILDSFTWTQSCDKNFKTGRYDIIHQKICMLMDTFVSPPTKYSVFTRYFEMYPWKNEQFKDLVFEIFDCIEIINNKYKCYDPIGAVCGSLAGYCCNMYPAWSSQIVAKMQNIIETTVSHIDFKRMDGIDSQIFGSLLTMINHFAFVKGIDMAKQHIIIIEPHISRENMKCLSGKVKLETIETFGRFGLASKITS